MWFGGLINRLKRERILIILRGFDIIFFLIVILCRGKFNFYVYILIELEFNKYFMGKRFSKYCNYVWVFFNYIISD